MALPKIAVIGASSSGKHSLVHAVLRQNADESTVHGPGPVQWSIDTKYYTATAEFHFCNVHDSFQDEGFEAVVLVFNSTQPESFEAVRSWLVEHESCTAEVQLAVSTHVDKILPQRGQQPDSPDSVVETARPAWLDGAIEWCSENCFEYIEACGIDRSFDRRLRLDGEQQGIPRVIEALQSHMWPGLVLKGTPQRQQQRDTDAASSTIQIHGQTGSPQQQEHMAQAAAAGIMASSIAESETALAGDVQGIGLGLLDGLDDDDDDEDGAMAGFEQLMLEMSAAKARVSNLPDDVRRQQAAQLALRFAAMLGLGAGEGEDGEEGSSDEDP